MALFLEQAVERVLNKEGQLIQNLEELGLNYDWINQHVFRSALEQLHRSRPKIVVSRVFGPMWRKPPDLDYFIRATSNFRLPSLSSPTAAIYCGRETRVQFEEDEYYVWVPMGYSAVFYAQKFEYLFERRVNEYPICMYDIHPGVPYKFRLPFEPIGEIVASSHDVDPSELIVSIENPDDRRDITITYTPADPTAGPITCKQAEPEYDYSSAYDFFNGGPVQSSAENYTSYPTLAITANTKYEFCVNDDWDVRRELVEKVITAKFLRAIANSKSMFTLNDVAFDVNADQLLSRISTIEADVAVDLNTVNSWWNF